MKMALIRSVVLCLTFFVAFLTTTIFLDALDKHTGYYDEGHRESAEVGK